MFSTFLDQWKLVLKKHTFRIEIVATLISLYALMVFSHSFFVFVELRKGLILNDILLRILPSINVSWIIFPLIYVSILTALCYLSFYPYLLLRSLQAYFLLTVFRITLIYFIPLDPPSGFVLLRDPLVDYFIYDQNIVTKDLFFSGHTSSLFLFYLVVKKKEIKMMLLLSTLLVGAFILIQHVHYTIDVLAAPFFSWFAWKCVLKLM